MQLKLQKQQKRKALQAAIEKNEQEIRAKKESLQEIVQQLTVKLYEQAQAAAGKQKVHKEHKMLARRNNM